MLLRIVGIILAVAVLILSIVFQDDLFENYSAFLPSIFALLGGLLLFLLLLPFIEFLRGREMGGAWRRRLEAKEGFKPSSYWLESLKILIQRLNKFLEEGSQKRWDGLILGWWVDSGFGSEPLSLIFAVFFIIGVGVVLGILLNTTAILSSFATFTLLIGFFVLIYSRARFQRQLFQDQFPGVLDRLADSLQAGFSLPQAIEFVIPNLSQPSSGEMGKISDQIRMGFTVDQALRELYQRRPSEDVRILVEGLTLQRQVGGNMAAMMREMAEMVRGRVELENEVRTMTAQGRLSAVVIALLVPVSLGLLSLFPGYTDVLFQTTVGNLVLIAAGILELIGGAIVIRLIRIEV
jgi:tight adherence protein B